MNDAYDPIRDLVRQALLDSAGDWNAAERLCHQRLADNPALREQIARLCLEWVIRNIITAEGRRHQQREADRLREMRETIDRAREIKQTVDEFLKDL